MSMNNVISFKFLNAIKLRNLTFKRNRLAHLFQIKNLTIMTIFIHYVNQVPDHLIHTSLSNMIC